MHRPQICTINKRLVTKTTAADAIWNLVDCSNLIGQEPCGISIWITLNGFAVNLIGLAPSFIFEKVAR